MMFSPASGPWTMPKISRATCPIGDGSVSRSSADRKSNGHLDPEARAEVERRSAAADAAAPPAPAPRASSRRSLGSGPAASPAPFGPGPPGRSRPAQSASVRQLSASQPYGSQSAGQPSFWTSDPNTSSAASSRLYEMASCRGSRPSPGSRRAPLRDVDRVGILARYSVTIRSVALVDDDPLLLTRQDLVGLGSPDESDGIDLPERVVRRGAGGAGINTSSPHLTISPSKPARPIGVEPGPGVQAGEVATAQVLGRARAPRRRRQGRLAIAERLGERAQALALAEDHAEQAHVRQRGEPRGPAAVPRARR